MAERVEREERGRGDTEEGEKNEEGGRERKDGG